uniref:Dynein light chain n=1 Tax=Rhizochromulina marina TaxID=1034831 RepID=A0A7S2RLM3_9STRA
MADGDPGAALVRKETIHQMDIPEEMCRKAIGKANEAMDQHTIEKDIATAIKTSFDKDYGGTWHCVAGRSFGCSVTHETKYLVFFQLDQTYVLLFCSDEPATGAETADANPGK